MSINLFHLLLFSAQTRNCFSPSIQQEFRCHKGEAACILSDHLGCTTPIDIPDACFHSFPEGNCPMLRLATATFSGGGSSGPSQAPFHKLLFFFTDLKSPMGLCQSRLFFEKATCLAKSKPHVVHAGALVLKKPPPANVCTCLWLTASLLTATTSHLPLRGYSRRKYSNQRTVVASISEGNEGTDDVGVSPGF